ncbi:adenylyltransferase and sulfurtransferase MOCS3 isoform X6 [Hydra vulgaris]|uniref:Adenylyltransferase and sulfurtransferase MOCS3 homolog n=1 Tax=Hydra vulgaris TaxID=6087 RepID=A0ABM4CHG9_HYDVU
MTSDIKARISVLEAELESLKLQLSLEKSSVDSELCNQPMIHPIKKCNLSNKDIQRYSRQIILPEVSAQGQVLIRKSQVLIVGVGGLGCPAAQYLVGAGIGTIGLVDYDTVELSNLHRQVLHRETNIGMSKVQSAISELKRLNSSTCFNEHIVSLSATNAFSIIDKYDIILDCTDNVATRYLLNDACVLYGKPLISGSALRFEGQLTVYNFQGGPCYRCLFPVPPPADAVANCSDSGVLGAVTGVIGSLQALEAVKLICCQSTSYNGSMLLFDGFRGVFRNIKLRGKKDICSVCGKNPTITHLVDQERFCGSAHTDKAISLSILPDAKRITVEEYANLRLLNKPHLLIDVRPKVEFDICSLPDSITINDILHNRYEGEHQKDILHGYNDVYIVCRRGNDSQKAVLYFLTEREKYIKTECVNIKDIKGGFLSWSKKVDKNFPNY